MARCRCSPSWLALLAMPAAFAGAAHATAVGPVTELFAPADFAFATTLINFDDASDGDVANTRYQAQGVAFQNTGAAIPIRDWAGIPRATTSAPNVIATIDRYQDTGSEFSDFLDLFFTAPTWEVGAFFGNDQGIQPTMQMQLSVFDASDALIGLVLVDVNANTSVDQFVGLRSDDTPFHRARFEHVLAQGDLSVVLDDVRFTAVPEPSSLALLGCALGTLAAARRPRRRGRAKTATFGSRRAPSLSPSAPAAPRA